MPIPQPNSGESEDDFVSRCMGADAMQEYDQEQRAAICYSTYRDRGYSQERSMVMVISDRVHELKQRRAELRKQLAPFTEKDLTRPAGEAMTKEDSDAFEAIMAELQELEERIERCERAVEAAVPKAETDNGDKPKDDDDDDKDKGYRGPGLDARLRALADPAPRSAGYGTMTRGGLRAYPQARPQPRSTEKGFRVARFMIGLVHAKWNGMAKATEFLDNAFHDDMVTKWFAEKALNYSVVAEGGALIPQDFVAELIELLRATVVVRGAGPMTIQMPMGNLTIPRLAGGSTAMYQGELDDISVTEEQFDDLNFIAKKLTAMVPVSNDLIRRAPMGVETIVRDDLVASIARKEDLNFIRGDGTTKGPVGWRSLVLPANLLVVPALGATPPVGADLNAVVSALAAMKLLLINGMSRMIRPAWFFAPTLVEYIGTRRDSVGGFYYKDEVARGTLEGFPIYTSQQIPTNLGLGNGSEFYLVDMADTVIADTLNVMVDASDVAAYYGTDGKVVSTFQRDQSLFRVISEHDFNMRHLQSLAVATTADWMFSGLPGVPGAPWSTQPLNPHWAQAPAAWPAAATHDAAPTVYDPSVVHTSAFGGTLTANPGGGPYPLPGTGYAGGREAGAGEGGAAQQPPQQPPNGGRGRSGPPTQRSGA
jgi:HK97 family phage major capsid protein